MHRGDNKLVPVGRATAPFHTLIHPFPIELALFDNRTGLAIHGATGQPTVSSSSYSPLFPSVGWKVIKLPTTHGKGGRASSSVKQHACYFTKLGVLHPPPPIFGRASTLQRGRRCAALINLRSIRWRFEDNYSSPFRAFHACSSALGF